MNTGDGEAAGAARPCPVLPGEPVHPAAAPAISTLSQAYKIRLAAFLLAGCAALSCGKPPAGATRRRRPRSQDQFISSQPLPGNREAAVMPHSSGQVAANVRLAPGQR
jgi:hypothetical protein